MSTEQLPGLPEGAFARMDPSPDAEFYADPRFVTHIDDAAIAAVTQAYRERLPPGGAVLDLMSSWVSHLPPEIEQWLAPWMLRGGKATAKAIKVERGDPPSWRRLLIEVTCAG